MERLTNTELKIQQAKTLSEAGLIIPKFRPVSRESVKSFFTEAAKKQLLGRQG